MYSTYQLLHNAKVFYAAHRQNGGSYYMARIHNSRKSFSSRLRSLLPRKTSGYSPSEYPVGKGLGKVSRSSSAVSGQFRSAQITDAKRRHKAAAASTSVTVGKPHPRRRIFSGVRESSLSKFLTIAAFSLVGIIGLALILISANSGGQQMTTSPNEPASDSAFQADSSTTLDDDGASVTVTVGGAIRLQDEILSAAASGSGYNFSNYLDDMKLIMKSDISIVGLLGTIDGYGSNASLSGYPAANYPSQLTGALSEMGITTVATANTASVSNGFDPMSKTISNLNAGGINAVGTYSSQQERNTVCVKKIDGICVGIGSYSCLTSGEIAAQTGTFADGQKAWCINQHEITEASQHILSDVQAMRSAGAQFIVIYLYWGSAADTSPTAAMRSLAQDLIDAGVDVTAGIGPNLVERVTVKKSSSTGKDCYVFYSLGNLFTDISSGAPQTTQQSLVVSFTLERAAGSDTVTLAKANYHPVYCNRDNSHATENTYLKYRVVPAARYVDAAARPEVFSTNDQWQRCKTTFTNIRTLIGNKLVLGDVEKVNSDQYIGGSGDNTSL